MTNMQFMRNLPVDAFYEVFIGAMDNKPHDEPAHDYLQTWLYSECGEISRAKMLEYCERKDDENQMLATG